MPEKVLVVRYTIAWAPPMTSLSRVDVRSAKRRKLGTAIVYRVWRLFLWGKTELHMARGQWKSCRHVTVYFHWCQSAGLVDSMSSFKQIRVYLSIGHRWLDIFQDKIKVFWDVTPCRLGYRCLGGSSWRLLQAERRENLTIWHCVTSKKLESQATWVWILKSRIF